MGCQPEDKDPCNGSSGNGNLHNLEGVVHAFQATKQAQLQRESEHFASQPTLEDAIEEIGHARRADGKRHSHQRCIRGETLAKVRKALYKMQPELKQCADFSGLFELMRGRVESIHGAGPLLCYDTAHRVGVYLGLKPQSVYVHQGAKEGAQALGIDCGRRRKIEVSELPKPLQELEPEELEDCLCIYKDELKDIFSS